MKHIREINIHSSSREEILPGFSRDFPYIATCAECDHYPEPCVPWHWHNSLELFYIQRGELRCTTPRGSYLFPAGSGGLVNSGVLHTTSWTPSPGGTVQLLHLFDPELLGCGPDSRIDREYIHPLVRESGIEMIPLYPDREDQTRLLDQISAAFRIQDTDFGYEFRIRQALGEIWLSLLEISRQSPWAKNPADPSGQRIKQMMVYVQEHYGEPITIDALSQAAHISRRMCFRLFRDYLHMTPVEYINAHRIQIACRMLAEDTHSITEIAYLCGLGSGSYFGKLFREAKGCTPQEYRRHWHDRSK